MRDTIASLSKQVAANTATAAETEIRASDPTYGQPLQNTRSSSAVNQNPAAPIRSNAPLPQRPQNPTTKQRYSNGPKGGPQSSARGGPQRETSASNAVSVNKDTTSAQPVESQGSNVPRAITRSQISTNTRGSSSDMGRPQVGVPNCPQGGPADRHDMNQADSAIDNGSSRGAPYRSNTSASVGTSRGYADGANRPKSVIVSRPCNEPRASFDLPQNGELSFSWSEDPVSDVEIVAHTNEPPVLAQKEYGMYAHQNRYDILRDALSDTLQREEAARKVADSADMSSVHMKSGGKRENEGYVDEPGDKDSYLDVASKYNWETENKRRKRGNSGEQLLPIYGVKNTPQRDIFVRDLAYSMCSSPEDLENRVKNHCRLRGVVLSFIKAFPIKSNCAKANCKITVSMEDVNNVLSENFWPQYVSARPWRLNPPNNAGNEDNVNKGLE